MIRKIMYMAGRYDNKIHAVEVVKETACFVTYIEHDYRGKSYETRLAREIFFDTWGEAHNSLMSRAMEKVIAARRSLELANAALGNIKGMKNPDLAASNKESEAAK